MASCKVYLHRKQHETEIRRFNFDTCDMTLLFFKAKLKTVFPNLEHCKDFAIYWEDQEGDNIKISSDEELHLAVSELANRGQSFFPGNIKPVLKFHISAETKDPSILGGQLHEGVMCDGCDVPVLGFRYKCLNCPDFDLCSKCEAQGLHPDHFMIRLPIPINLGRGFCRRWGRGLQKCYRKNSGHWRNQTSEGNKCQRPQDGANSWSEKMESVVQFLNEFLDQAINASGDEGTTSGQETQNKKQQQQEPPASKHDKYLNTFRQNLAHLLDPLGASGLDLPGAAQGNTASSSSMQTEENQSGQANSNSGAVHFSTPPEQLSTTSSTPPPKSFASQRMEMDNGDNGWTLLNAGTSSASESMNVSEAVRPKTVAPNNSDANETGTQTAQVLPQRNDKVEQSLQIMLNMGFNNEGDWLRQMLTSKGGDIESVLDLMMPMRKFTSK